MATVTAGALIVAGLRRASVIDAVNGFILHPASGGGEAFDLLNAAVSELTDILYEADSEAYATTKTPFSSANGTADYPLLTIAGSTFYHVKAIEYNDGQKWRGLDRVKFDQRNDYPTPGTPQGYAAEGANVTVFPTPNAIFSMRIIFEPLPTTSAADVDVIDLQGPWREFVERHIASAALEKKESDNTTQEAKLYGTATNPGGLAGRIRNAAKKRDMGGAAPSPVDVQGDNDPLVSW